MDSEHQSTLVSNLSRFAPSAVMLIHTIVNDSKAPFYVDRDSIAYIGNYSHYTGSYIVSATYDQGGIQVSSSDMPMIAYQPIERVMPFSSVVSFWIGIATILFTSMIIYVGFIRVTRWPQLNTKLAGILIVADVVLIMLMLYFSGIVTLALLLVVTVPLTSVIAVLGVIWVRYRNRQHRNQQVNQTKSPIKW